MKRKRTLGMIIFALSIILWGAMFTFVYACPAHQEIKSYVFVFGSIVTYWGLNYSHDLIFKNL